MLLSNIKVHLERIDAPSVSSPLKWYSVLDCNASPSSGLDLTRVSKFENRVGWKSFNHCPMLQGARTAAGWRGGFLEGAQGMGVGEREPHGGCQPLGTLEEGGE